MTDLPGVRTGLSNHSLGTAWGQHYVLQVLLQMLERLVQVEVLVRHRATCRGRTGLVGPDQAGVGGGQIGLQRTWANSGTQLNKKTCLVHRQLSLKLIGSIRWQRDIRWQLVSQMKEGLGVHQLVVGSTGPGHSLLRLEWQEKSYGA